MIHFAMEDVNILTGVGKGVMGIKLDDDDVCLGAAVMGPGMSRLVMEVDDGQTKEFTNRHEQVGRGGKGFKAVTRRSFGRVVPPAIELADWDALAEKEPKKENGDKGLFE